MYDSQAIVLDLDQTIIASLQGSEIYHEIQDYDDLEIQENFRKIIISDIDHTLVKRKHLHEFLKFCFENFQFVCIWSAGQREYVDTVVKLIFEDFMNFMQIQNLRGDNSFHRFRREYWQCTPDLVLCWDDVEGLTKRYFKPLDKVCTKINNLMDGFLQITKDDIILIDDKLDNMRKDPGNGIVVVPFDPKTLEDCLNLLHTDNELINIIQKLSDILVSREMLKFGICLTEYCNLCGHHHETLKIYGRFSKFSE